MKKKAKSKKNTLSLKHFPKKSYGLVFRAMVKACNKIGKTKVSK